MKFQRKSILALVAGIVLYQLYGAQIDHLHALVDSLVCVELVSRTISSDDSK